MIYIHKFETRDDYKKFIKDSYIEPHVSVTKYKNSGGVISFLGSIDNEGANDSGETFTYAYMQNSEYFYLTNVNMSEVSQYDDENITITVDGVVYANPFQLNESEFGWQNENSACITSSLEPSVGDVAKLFSFGNMPVIASSRNFEVGEVFSDGIPSAVTVLEIIDKEQPSEEINKVSYNFKYVQPLTFNILSSGTIKWICRGSGDFVYKPITIKYKKNNEEWVSITSDYSYNNPPTIIVNAGDVLMFTGTRAPGNIGGFNYFGGTATYEVSGNIMSLLNDGDFNNKVNLVDFVFYNLFNSCTGLTSAENLVLPATTLANYCYSYMFSHCSSLTAAPELPATTLAEGCYDTMFWGCTSLNYIKCLATDISAYNCTYAWVNNVASSGTFVKNPNMNDWTTGISGIPNGWTVQDAS